MIKLVVSDIDGTLLEDGGHQLKQELYDAILRLRKQGIQFAAASGRQWASIEAVFEPVKEKIFYLSDNGAYIGCHGRNLFLNTIDRKAVMDLVHMVKQQKDLDVMISGADDVYVDTKNREFIDWMVQGYRFRVREVEDLTKVEDEIIKISVYKKNSIETATASIREAFEDRLKITISGDMWMDCMAPGVNKGEAVKLLQESLDIQVKETMAFGDQLNDIEMLGRAYYSFAIGNARQEVKEAARFQADTNKNDGVLKILNLI